MTPSAASSRSAWALHYGRVLAAHLHDHRLGEPLAERLEHAVEADLIRAGEEQPVDPFVLLQLRADDGTRAADHVEDAMRQSGQVRYLGELDAAQRRIAGWLVDNRVAGHQSAAAGPPERAMGKLKG